MCWNQVVSIPTARQDTELPVRVNTESHAKHLSFWLGRNSQYSRWKGRGFTETERLFSSGLETTWPFNHISKPVFLKVAYFVGRMCTYKPSFSGSLQSLSGACRTGIQPVCGCSASPKYLGKTAAWDDWRSSWTYPKSAFKHKLKEKCAAKKQSRFALRNCTCGQSLLRAVSTIITRRVMLALSWSVVFFKDTIQKVFKGMTTNFSEFLLQQRQSSFGRNSLTY